MQRDTSKVRKSFSLFWAIGAILLILFATRTGAGPLPAFMDQSPQSGVSVAAPAATDPDVAKTDG